MSARFRKANATGRSSGQLGGRYGKLMRPPEGEPWIWLPRAILASDAWRSLGINARRFMDFLFIEHLNHAGRENGNLRATYEQLERFGIGARYVAAAIQQAEDAGLVACQRGGMRVATTYTITFYAQADGTPASDSWRRFRAAEKNRNLPHEGKADHLPKGR